MIILNSLKSIYYNFVTTVRDIFCVILLNVTQRTVELKIVLMKFLVVSYNNG